MNRIKHLFKQSFPLVVLFWSATNLPQISLAQVNWVSPAYNQVAPAMPDLVCGGSNPRCRRENGKIIDNATGDVYDRKGNLLQRGSGSSNRDSYTPTPMPSGTYRLKQKDIFTFTNQSDPMVATGQYSNFSGNYSGKYTLPFAFSLGIPIKGTLTLNQNGDQVFGTLVTETDREAQLQGNVQGSQFVGKLIFTDSCGGEGSVMGDLSPTGDLLIGRYKVADCLGRYGGRYKVKRSSSEQ
jgi:hypothetical protein